MSRTRRRLLDLLTRIGRAFLPLMGGDQTQLLLLGSVTGVVVALGAIGFGRLVAFFHRLTFGGDPGRLSFAQLETPLPHLLEQPLWWIVLAPVVGGILVGPIVHRFAREAKGHGIPEVMEAVALRDGRIRKRVAVVKVLTSAITIGSGGSAGREGPIVQIGASIASAVSQLLGLAGKRSKTLVACGAAAGIASTFNAPIAGVIFSLEIITGSFGLSAFTPVVAAAVMSTTTTHYLQGREFVFYLPPGIQDATALTTPVEVLPYAALGVFAGLLSISYIHVLYATEDRFDRMRFVPVPLRAAVGGLGVGLIALILPRVMGQGYDTIFVTLGDLDLPLLDRHPEVHLGLSPTACTAIALLVLSFVKMMATALTIGSGGSGGVFAPSLFIGATFGGSFGLLVHSWFPQSTSTPVGYALVGMGAVVAGVTHAPISAVLILFEMTDDYDVILPLMLASSISTAVATHLLPDSIYMRKLRRKGVVLHSGQDQSILSDLRVRDAMRREVPSILETTPFRQVVRIVTHSTASTFPVVDESQRLRGLLTFDELRSSLHDVDELGDLVIAKELANPEWSALAEDDSLAVAFHRFEESGLDEIPVIDREDPERLVGMLARAAAMNSYQRALRQRHGD